MADSQDQTAEGSWAAEASCAAEGSCSADTSSKQSCKGKRPAVQDSESVRLANNTKSKRNRITNAANYDESEQSLAESMDEMKKEWDDLVLIAKGFGLTDVEISCSVFEAVPVSTVRIAEKIAVYSRLIKKMLTRRRELQAKILERQQRFSAATLDAESSKNTQKTDISFLSNDEKNILIGNHHNGILAIEYAAQDIRKLDRVLQLLSHLPEQLLPKQIPETELAGATFDFENGEVANSNGPAVPAISAESHPLVKPATVPPAMEGLDEEINNSEVDYFALLL